MENSKLQLFKQDHDILYAMGVTYPIIGLQEGKWRDLECPLQEKKFGALCRYFGPLAHGIVSVSHDLIK